MMAALLRETVRLVAEDDDDLVFHIQMRVVIVLKFVSRCTVSRKNDLTFE